MMHKPAPPALADLRERVRCLEGRAARDRRALPFGVADIDARLPGGGLVLGALHEVAGGGSGAVDGAAAALFAAGIAARTKGRVLWCVTRQDLFAPALAQAGLAPGRVIHVEAGDDKALMACFEDGLRHDLARVEGASDRRRALSARVNEPWVRRSVKMRHSFGRRARGSLDMPSGWRPCGSFPRSRGMPAH